jgi:mannose-1-phosphate guanylyltransferase
MDEVIQKLIKGRKKISVFPIKDKDWKDTGNWSSYFDIFKKNAEN